MQNMGCKTIILFCNSAKTRGYRISVFGDTQKLDTTVGPDDHQTSLLISVILPLYDSALSNTT